jgi:quinol monooxygenase YgiN
MMELKSICKLKVIYLLRYGSEKKRIVAISGELRNGRISRLLNVWSGKITDYYYIEQMTKTLTISTENKYLTLINVFTVDPPNQQKLIDLLTTATETTVSHVKGFISSALHSSLDGKKVTMYAQWESLEDYQAMRDNSMASPYLDQALGIASFDPGNYAVVKTF